MKCFPNPPCLEVLKGLSRKNVVPRMARRVREYRRCFENTTGVMMDGWEGRHLEIHPEREGRQVVTPVIGR